MAEFRGYDSDAAAKGRAAHDEERRTVSEAQRGDERKKGLVRRIMMRYGEASCTVNGDL